MAVPFVSTRPVSVALVEAAGVEAAVEVVVVVI